MEVRISGMYIDVPPECTKADAFSFFCCILNEMMKYALLFLLSTLTLGTSAQTTLEGFVRAADNGEPVPSAYVVNKSSFKNVITNGLGFFSIEVEAGDSIVLSQISYNYTYYVVPDSLGKKHVEIIVMEPRNYLIDEVEVYAYNLTTNQPRAMKLEEPNVPLEGTYNTPTQLEPSISAPVDLLYWYFGSRPRQLRELQRLQKEDAYREQLRTGSNREILMEITGLSTQELEAFAWSCKYTGNTISTINDYELLVSLLNCYQDYVERIKQQSVLEDAENGWGE
ncbi:hypothetical protein GCM10011318_17280 [Phaeocystidibacter marisrubri]|nr:hypothetical protein GCM10011318_17280 [Phaeocystidibacter marisrubri]